MAAKPKHDDGLEFVERSREVLSATAAMLADDDLANMMTYVFNTMGNKKGAVSKADVARIRATTPRPPGAAH